MNTNNPNEILEHAAAQPDDVSVRMAAAYHCDAHRTEAEAVVHYDAAWALGVPADLRREFMLGYGSTLKNVGRLSESEGILRQAVEDHPEDKALPVFLALTLHAAGRSDHAIAQLLDVLLRCEDPDIGRYARAVSFYASELREAPHAGD